MNTTTRPRRHARSGTILIICIALVAIASMVAFGLAMTARGTQVAGRRAVAGELAKSAARMGARHALEVGAAAVLAARPGTGEWPFLASFGHLDRDLAANLGPDGSHLRVTDWAPNPYDGGDNVAAEDKLSAVHQPFGSGQDQQGYLNSVNFSTDGKTWPWPVNPNSTGGAGWNVAKGAILNPCVPRWIEPGFYSDDMAADPVRFNAADPAPQPVRASRPVEPIYYDSRWRPTTSRSQARYRLRYAVVALDLGGHYRWGRQLGYIDNTAGAAFSDLTGANPLLKTPHEWDETTARGYAVALRSMLGKTGCSETTYEDKDSCARPTALAMFLGRGSAKIYNDNWYDSMDPSYLLCGFTAGSRPDLVLPSALGVYSDASKTRDNGGSQSAIAVGGPPSWQAASSLIHVDLQSGFWPRWSASPFGRCNEFDPAAAGTRYFKGRTDNPWRINLLTAPPETIGMMLYGYVPQVALKAAWDKGTLSNWVWNAGNGKTEWTVAATVNYNGLPRALLHEDASVDPTSTLFHPRSMRIAPYSASLAASGRSSLFDPFTSPDYLTSAVTATTYDGAYPGPKEEWEDYARLELYPQVNSIYVAGTANAHPMVHADAAQDYGGLYKCMLGARITTFNYPRDPLPASAYSASGTGSLTQIADPGWDWTSGATYPWTRMSVLSNGGRSVGGGPPDAGWYTATPFEPMRGSGAWLARRRVADNDNGKYTVMFKPSSPQQAIYNDSASMRDRRYFFRDSYWLDLMTATAAAVSTAKALYQDAGSVGSAAVVSPYSCANLPAGWKPTTIRDIDALFLSYLGEWHPALPMAAGSPSTPGTLSTPPTFIAAKQLSGKWDLEAPANILVPRRIIDYRADGNIAMLHHGNDTGAGFLSDPVANPATAASGVGLDKNLAWRKSTNMERVLNDWRMSFFGANPEYTDFAPLDFNGDGYATCSAYGSAALNIPAKSGVTVPDPSAPPPASISVNLPARSYPSMAVASPGVGPAPQIHFSLTGFLAFEKIRYVRTLVRGVVWDSLRQSQVASADLDAVLAIDPDGDATVTPAPADASGLGDSATLYQHWVRNYYVGSQSQTAE